MRDVADYVTVQDTGLTTDSRRVAKHLGKAHKNVLRAVDLLDCSAEFRRLNFEPTMVDGPGPKGATRQERQIRMTKDGFMFLAMSFTGKEAAAIKEAYITAFNAMAAELQHVLDSLILSCRKARWAAAHGGRNIQVPAINP